MFRVSIRDLLLVTVIVGLALGWWLEHRRHVALAQAHSQATRSFATLKRLIENRGCRVEQGHGSMTLYGSTGPGDTLEMSGVTGECEVASAWPFSWR